MLRLSADKDSERDRANRPRAAISRGPKLMRGPVRWRISDAPASGLLMTLSIATKSATSGTWTSPPKPRTSEGMPASANASWISAICARLRTRTAKVFGTLAPALVRSGLFQSGAKYSAIALASPSRFSKIPQVRFPFPAPLRGLSAATVMPSSLRTSAEISLARVRIDSSLR